MTETRAVPVEATQAMLDAGYLAISQGRGAKSAWQEMLSAAPAPNPSADGDATDKAIDDAVFMRCRMWRSMANKVHAEWDAGNDARVGKMLIAMADPNFAAKYGKEYAALHAPALNRAQEVEGV